VFNYKYILGLIFLIIIGWFIHQRFIKYPVRYVGYFYPDTENYDSWVESQPLKSIEGCRDWVNTQISNSDDYDYECGKDCYKGDPYNQGVNYTCNSSLR